MKFALGVFLLITIIIGCSKGSLQGRQSSVDEFGFPNSTIVSDDGNTRTIVSANRSCPGANQYLVGINADGSLTCKDLPNCGEGKQFQGFDLTGNPICKTIASAFTASSCAAGQYVKGINADGSLKCVSLKCNLKEVTVASGKAGTTITGSCASGELMTSCWASVVTTSTQFLWTSITSTGAVASCSAKSNPAFRNGKMGLTCCKEE